MKCLVCELNLYGAIFFKPFLTF